MARIDILGYGECPNSGPFMLDGYCEIVPKEELLEKEGLKLEANQQSNEPIFMKLKIGKVVIYKKYYNFKLQEIIERKRSLNIE